MSVVGLRELLRNPREVFERLDAGGGEPIVITRYGKPVAALIAADERRLEQLMLSSAPTVLEAAHDAENAVSGGRTTSLGALLEDDPDEASTSATTQSHAEPVDDLHEALTRIAREVAAEVELSPALSVSQRATVSPSEVGVLQEIAAEMIETALHESVATAKQRALALMDYTAQTAPTSSSDRGALFQRLEGYARLQSAVGHRVVSVTMDDRLSPMPPYRTDD
jgi:antitoxin (DNA-binding transcriptional repressor) of toxin-antitoxin stability system